MPEMPTLPLRIPLAPLSRGALDVGAEHRGGN